MIVSTYKNSSLKEQMLNENCSLQKKSSASPFEVKNFFIGALSFAIYLFSVWILSEQYKINHPDSVSPSPKEYHSQIESLKKEIESLNKEVLSLKNKP